MLRFVLPVLVSGIAFACGSRTPLDTSNAIDSGLSEAGENGSDAGARDRDSGAQPGCADPESIFIYLISQQRELYAFDPKNLSTRDIGAVQCPTTDSLVYSMAVDRTGVAYVIFFDGLSPAHGSLWKVNTTDASCLSVPEYVPNQQGFNIFGMGFATNADSSSETLFVQGTKYYGGKQGLASIDTTTFELTFIGEDSTITQGDLIGGTTGRLFSVFSRSSNSVPIYLGELDKTNGQLLSQIELTNINAGGPTSASYWGTSFYFFTAPAADTFVTTFDPTNGQYETVTTISSTKITGAGVSTCGGR